MDWNETKVGAPPPPVGLNGGGGDARNVVTYLYGKLLRYVRYVYH